jgi:hypothetical protein
MNLLHLLPENWYSWRFRLEREGLTVAFLTVSSWREKGTIRIDEAKYEILRASLEDSSLPRRGFVMRSLSGEYVAHAYRRSIWCRSLAFRYGTNEIEWTLDPVSIWKRRLLLREDKEEVGSITPIDAWTRRAQAQLPDQMPLRVQVFALWLAALIWKRDSDAGAVAAVVAVGG